MIPSVFGCPQIVAVMAGEKEEMVEVEEVGLKHQDLPRCLARGGSFDSSRCHTYKFVYTRITARRLVSARRAKALDGETNEHTLLAHD